MDRKKKRFFRLNHETTMQGLWYDFEGKFTGLIHGEYSFCFNRDLKMDFDSELVGYLSAVETLEDLFIWFPKKDILRLQGKGYYAHEYLSDNYKWYERFNHYVINQEGLELVQKIVLTEEEN